MLIEAPQSQREPQSEPHAELQNKERQSKETKEISKGEAPPLDTGLPCIKCGKVVLQKAKFCRSCGTYVTKTAVAQSRQVGSSGIRRLIPKQEPEPELQTESPIEVKQMDVTSKILKPIKTSTKAATGRRAATKNPVRDVWNFPYYNYHSILI